MRRFVLLIFVGMALEACLIVAWPLFGTFLHTF